MLEYFVVDPQHKWLDKFHHHHGMQMWQLSKAEPHYLPIERYIALLSLLVSL